MRIDRVKLATELARRDMKINRLAEMSDLSRMTVSAIRNGKSCTHQTADKIARALGVDVTEIMEDER